MVNRIRCCSRLLKAKNNLWPDLATKAATTTPTDGLFRWPVQQQNDTTRRDSAEVERFAERLCRWMQRVWPMSMHLEAPDVSVERLMIGAAASRIVVVVVADCRTYWTGGPHNKEAAVADVSG